LPPDSAVCASCGAAHGETNRCPHCHAVADVEPHPALGFRCLVCGGPRVALNISGVVPSASTLAALSSAGKRQTEHLVYSSAGFVLLAMGALALVIATVVLAAASPGVVPTVAAYLGALVPVVAGALALARSASARTRRREALHAAQVSALGDVQAVTGVLDAARVAEIMRLSTERAELLLAEASVASLLDHAPAPRVRVPALTATEPGPMPFEEAQSEVPRPGARTARGDTEI
jgi:hypothetical protein